MDVSKQLLKLAFSGKWEELKDFLTRHSRSVNFKINCRSRDKATALIHAVQGARKYKKNEDTGIDHEKVCELLLQHGVDLDLQDQKRRTAVHWAVFYENASLLSLFIHSGADLEIQDEDGYNCLIFAMNNDNIGAINCICEVDADWETLLDECTGLPPLLYAVELGKTDIVKIFVKNNCNLNVIERNKSKRTALHIAIQHDKYSIFELLLRHSAKADIKDGGGKTVFKRAASHVNSSYLQLLLAEDKMSSESINESGCTALMLACQAENITNVNSLLEKRGDITAVDRSGKTALHHCVENKQTRCATAILDYDSSILNAQDKDGYSCLHLSVITGNAALLQLLIDRGANINSTDNEKHTVVHWATVCGQIKLLDIIMGKSAVLSTPDIHDAYPIHYAAQMAGMNAEGMEPGVGMKILQKLLSKGIPVDVTDHDKRQPLLWAASAGSSDACLALINAGAKVESADKDGLTALHCAASRGHPECIQTLVEHKATIDCKDKNECSPLFYAITLNHEKCTSCLLELGANPSFRDKKGRSPAHCAAAKGLVSCLTLLEEKNANLWLKNNRGEYPLHEGAQAGHTDAVNFLIEDAKKKTGNKGLKVLSSGNTDGRTCLHVAAMTNHLELIKLLLDNGANINAIMKSKSKNEYFTPYDTAVLKGNMECAEYLKSHGAATGQKVTGNAAKTIQRNLRKVHRNKESRKNSHRNSMEVLDKGENVIEAEINADKCEADYEIEFIEDKPVNRKTIDMGESGKECHQSQPGLVIESTQESEPESDILNDDAKPKLKEDSSESEQQSASDQDQRSSDADNSFSKNDKDEVKTSKFVEKDEEQENQTNQDVDDKDMKITDDESQMARVTAENDLRCSDKDDIYDDDDDDCDEDLENDGKSSKYSEKDQPEEIQEKEEVIEANDLKIEAVSDDQEEEEGLNIKAEAAPEACVEHLYKKDPQQDTKEKQKALRPVRSSKTPRSAKPEPQNCRPKTSLKHSDDVTNLKSPRNPHSGKSKIAKSVQDSVRNFEYTRMVVKELHRLRKAQIHKDRNQDIVVIRRFIEQYRKDGKLHGDDPQINTMDDWERYLRAQRKHDEQRRFEREAHEAHERQNDENYRRRKKFKEKEDSSLEKKEKSGKEMLEIAQRTDNLFNNANKTADELLLEARASNNDPDTTSSKKSSTPSSHPKKGSAQRMKVKSDNLIKAYRPQLPPGVFENTYKLHSSSGKPKSSYGNRGQQSSGSFPQINGNQKRAQSSKPSNSVAMPERKLSPAQYKMQSQSYPRSHPESGMSNNTDTRQSSKSSSHNDKLPDNGGRH
ncbi:uncharacterized protein LOC141915005 isoform X2 [Tubulanus polymorphus]|uniref:uncharacterized protein LOC141915005 isoform X2 n=1 Tax=Tubulanus polymorphus TaxID=672921 RepID=UPI003DA55B81